MVRVRAKHAVVVASAAAVFAAGLSLTVGAGPADAFTQCTPTAGFSTCVRFDFTGTDQVAVVPKGLTGPFDVRAWGAGGGGGNVVAFSNQVTAGGGGFTSGELADPAGTALTVVVGQGGIVSSTVSTYGGGGGGGAGTSAGSSGGGLTGVFHSGAPVLIAGGGGGASIGAGTVAGYSGGGGGGTIGGGGFPADSGQGGTQTSGGAAATDNTGCTTVATPGASLQGGVGASMPTFEGGGGGGGGFFGGGGGSCQAPATPPLNGGGGGGSGFLSPAVAGGATVNGAESTTVGVGGASGGASDDQYIAGIGAGGGFSGGGNGMVVFQFSLNPSLMTSPALGSTTANNVPPLSGTGAPGTAVTVSEGGSLVCGPALVSTAGTWTCAPLGPLAEGSHTFIVATADPGAPGLVYPTSTNSFIVALPPTQGSSGPPAATVGLADTGSRGSSAPWIGAGLAILLGAALITVSRMRPRRSS